MNYLDLSKFKTCSCGTTVESDDCDENNKYTWLGWFFWTMGTTAIPIETSFYCKKCGIVFERLTDREIIKYYMLYKKK